MVGIWIMLEPYGNGNIGCTSARSELCRSRAIAIIRYRDLWFWIAWYNYRFLSLTPEIWVQPVSDVSKTCQNRLGYATVWTFFSMAFLWDWNENWTFPVLWSPMNFPNLLAYWVQHFNSVILRIWNSSTGISSPLLAWFIVMIPKAHLTSHSRMFGSSWVITPSWLSGSWSSFLYSSSVCCCHLLISSASVSFCPFLCPPLHERYL